MGQRRTTILLFISLLEGISTCIVVQIRILYWSFLTSIAVVLQFLSLWLISHRNWLRMISSCLLLHYVRVCPQTLPCPDRFPEVSGYAVVCNFQKTKFQKHVTYLRLETSKSYKPEHLVTDTYSKSTHTTRYLSTVAVGIHNPTSSRVEQST